MSDEEVNNLKDSTSLFFEPTLDLANTTNTFKKSKYLKHVDQTTVVKKLIICKNVIKTFFKLMIYSYSFQWDFFNSDL